MPVPDTESRFSRPGQAPPPHQRRGCGASPFQSGPAKPAKPKAKPAKAAKKPAAKKKRKINPLTQQPYAKKDGGYVAEAKVHADNIKLAKRKDKPKKKKATACGCVGHRIFFIRKRPDRTLLQPLLGANSCQRCECSEYLDIGALWADWGRARGPVPGAITFNKSAWK
mgnify:CR=1 FL=1